jgi:hypothetical protein
MVRAISLINVPISNVVLKSGQIKSHEVAIQRKLRIDEISQKLGFMEKHQVILNLPLLYPFTLVRIEYKSEGHCLQ